MRFSEVINPLRTFTARVRVSITGGTMILRTQVQADGIVQARALLLHTYGAGNLLALTQ